MLRNLGSYTKADGRDEVYNTDMDQKGGGSWEYKFQQYLSAVLGIEARHEGNGAINHPIEL